MCGGQRDRSVESHGPCGRVRPSRSQAGAGRVPSSGECVRRANSARRARSARKGWRAMSVPTAGVWDRRAWAAGIVFVLALLAEAVISAGIPINQDDSAAKIARALQEDRQTVLVAGYLSAVYAVAFVIYLAKLHDRLHGVSQRPGLLRPPPCPLRPIAIPQLLRAVAAAPPAAPCRAHSTARCFRVGGGSSRAIRREPWRRAQPCARRRVCAIHARRRHPAEALGVETDRADLPVDAPTSDAGEGVTPVTRRANCGRWRRRSRRRRVCLTRLVEAGIVGVVHSGRPGEGPSGGPEAGPSPSRATGARTRRATSRS